MYLSRCTDARGTVDRDIWGATPEVARDARSLFSYEEGIDIYDAHSVCIFSRIAKLGVYQQLWMRYIAAQTGPEALAPLNRLLQEEIPRACPTLLHYSMTTWHQRQADNTNVSWSMPHPLSDAPWRPFKTRARGGPLAHRRQPPK